MQLVETYFKFVFVKQKLKLFSFGICLGQNKLVQTQGVNAVYGIKTNIFDDKQKIMGSNKNDRVTLMIVKRTLKWILR